MQSLKTLHVFCAYITGLGFLLRGVLILLQNPLSQHRLTKVLPHIIDTCLLISGGLLAYSFSFSPLTQPWLAAKIMALFMYIGFGLMMLRFGNTLKRQSLGLLGGLLVYSYIIGAAHSKSIYSYLFFL